MKKILLIVLFSFFTFCEVKSQNQYNYINEQYDMINDKSYFYSKSPLVLYDDAIKMGFMIDVSFVYELKCELIITFIDYNENDCNVRNLLIIDLVNSKQIIKTSDGKFNCDGTCKFILNDSDINNLMNFGVMRIMLRNGYDGVVLSIPLNIVQKSYFLNIFQEKHKIAIK